MNEEENIKYLVDMSMRLEGLPRHSSTHAQVLLFVKNQLWNMYH